MTAVIPGNTHNQFNLTSQSARQAGSTFKTFVLAAAIEKGMDPDSTYYTSAPFTCTTGPVVRGRLQGRKALDGQHLRPHLRRRRSRSRARRCARTTRCTPSSPSTSAPTSSGGWRSRLGVHLTQKPVASIGLGALSVSPLDMAAAYATFADGGIYATPDRDPEGDPAEREDRQDAGASRRPSACSRRASPGRSPTCSAQNALYGTGPGSGDGVHPNAGKTGTTTDHADAWFDGYTRDFSTVVWMGYPRGEIPMLDVHGQAVAGATFPVPIWHLYMEQAEKGRPARQFQTPPSYPVYAYFQKGYWGYLAVPTTPATTTTHHDHHHDAKPSPATIPAEGNPARGQSAAAGHTPRRPRVAGARIVP